MDLDRRAFLRLPNEFASLIKCQNPSVMPPPNPKIVNNGSNPSHRSNTRPTSPGIIISIEMVVICHAIA